MQQTRRHHRWLHTLAALLAGTAAAAVIWLAGGTELTWLGFLAVALAWPATAAISDRQTTRALSASPDTIPIPELPLGHYVLDPTQSLVRFTVRKLRLYPVHASLRFVAGTVDVDPHQAHVAAAVATATLNTRNSARDRHVIGPAFLDARHHPTLRFDGSVAPDHRTVAGTMTIRGVQAPVTFVIRNLDWSRQQRRLHVSTETTLQRSTFGVTAYRWLAGDNIVVRVQASLVPSNAE